MRKFFGEVIEKNVYSEFRDDFYLFSVSKLFSIVYDRTLNKKKLIFEDNVVCQELISNYLKFKLVEIKKNLYDIISELSNIEIYYFLNENQNYNEGLARPEKMYLDFFNYIQLIDFDVFNKDSIECMSSDLIFCLETPFLSKNLKKCKIVGLELFGKTEQIEFILLDGSNITHTPLGDLEFSHPYPHYAIKDFCEKLRCDQIFKDKFDSILNECSLMFIETNNELKVFLDNLFDQYNKGNLTGENLKIISEYSLKQKPVFTLSSELTVASIKNGKYKPSILKEENQIAILFDVLCECGLFLNFDKKTKAFFASLFTGESEQKLREAFIDEVSVKGQKDYIPKNSIADYQRVMELVEEIRELLRSRLDKFQEK